MKKLFKIASLILTIALILTMFAGCGADSGKSEDSSQSANGDKTLTIGFSVKTVTNDEFFKTVVDSARKTVEDAGYKFELTIAGSGDAKAVDQQIKNVEDLINMGVDAIVVAPMDGNAIIPALMKAKEANIPVVVIDAPIAEGNDDLFAAFVGTDNYNSAYEAGKQMINALPNGGDVVMVRGSSGSRSGEERAKGFTDALEGSNLNIVNQQAGDWVNDTAMKVTENMLQANPDIVGLFTVSDVMYDGIWSAIENAGKQDQITIVSHDGFKLAVDAVKEGHMYCTVMQRPIAIGSKGAQAAIDVVLGKPVEKNIDTGFIVMDKSNVDENAQFTF